MKTIVVGVDFSNAAPVVIDKAIELATALQASISLLHVIEPEPSMSAYGFTPEEFPIMTTFQNEARRRAKARLEELLAEVRLKVPSATSHIMEGSPLYSLIDYIKATNADMAIIGSHGHGVIASLLLGTVAEGLVRKSVVPTLVVPVAEERA